MKRISLGEKVDLSQEMSEAISNQENLFEESFTNQFELYKANDSINEGVPSDKRRSS